MEKELLNIAAAIVGRADIITGTLGKAMGGAMGGLPLEEKEIIDMLRRKSRLTFIFINSYSALNSWSWD